MKSGDKVVLKRAIADDDAPIGTVDGLAGEYVPVAWPTGSTWRRWQHPDNLVVLKPIATPDWGPQGIVYPRPHFRTDHHGWDGGAPTFLRYANGVLYEHGPDDLDDPE